MKLKDKIAELQGDRPYFTFEFFPPRTKQGFDNLLVRIARLSKLHPIAINVTWGAGGSTQDRSFELASCSRSRYDLDTILHLTCTNMELGSIDRVLKEAAEKGIENILALRGDPPRGAEYWLPTDPRFMHAIDLVSHIRSSPYSGHFCVGVAGYPDGHPDKLLNEEQELENLKAKVDAGADFIVTQLFYDTHSFSSWVQKVRAKGIQVPIIPGIMPIQNYSSFLRLTKLCGTRVPKEILHALEPIRTDDQQVKQFGIVLATEMIQSIVKSTGIRGFHFCTLNLEKSVQSVLENLNWVGRQADTLNRVISDDSFPKKEPPKPKPLTDSDLRVAALTALTEARHSLASDPLSPHPSSHEAGKGELNHASTWDEFPNGRFGDIKSPAYGGGVDLWTSGVAKSREAKWVGPTSPNAITDAFLSYLKSHQTDSVELATPFTSDTLSSESLTILAQLLELTSKGCWTVGSQPAVDGTPSSDAIVGWGPVGGWVYQKAFVEFFANEEDILRIENLIQSDGKGVVTFFAGDGADGFTTNMGGEGRNAVTWGVFPGHEIEQSTIIERESFLAWKEEVFDLWNQWALSYSPSSDERKCLDEVRTSRWLISIVHHDYKTPDALWTFLRKAF